eukprot:TRINITY_DN1163_c0_g1_i1.p1 TRINITY_DN1163_c0_g1~~TRINITY_DN1163_c0_g1_i1.p1  ORF type:complete len:213 (-),score=34.12 TRINITY_DN1163_c0_g1_i1:17-655(-)
MLAHYTQKQVRSKVDGLIKSKKLPLRSFAPIITSERQRMPPQSAISHLISTYPSFKGFNFPGSTPNPPPQNNDEDPTEIESESEDETPETELPVYLLKVDALEMVFVFLRRTRGYHYQFTWIDSTTLDIEGEDYLSEEDFNLLAHESGLSFEVLNHYIPQNLKGGQPASSKHHRIEIECAVVQTPFLQINGSQWIIRSYLFQKDPIVDPDIV